MAYIPDRVKKEILGKNKTPPTNAVWTEDDEAPSDKTKTWSDLYGKSKIKLEELPAEGDYNPMKVTVASVMQFYI